MMDVTVLTNNGVDVNHGLELLGDMEMYNDTLKDFLEESKTRINNIINYYNAQDWVNYEILVHAQKSDSKYLGFTQLAEMSYNHEMAAKGNDINYIVNNINPLINEANRIVAVVKAYLGVE
jgi:HPt (histidine-containing phosphotransfer) domain-containing protein